MPTHTSTNGVAERKNQHILEVARAMINEKHLRKSYWSEVANTTIYLMNCCTTSGVHDITRYEKFYGKKSELSHTWIFGSIAFVHIPEEKRQNLYTKSEKCILVGYSLEQKGYRCFNPSTWYTVDSASSDPIKTDFSVDTEEDDVTKSHIRRKSNLNRVEWTTRASKGPKHMVSKFEDGQR